MSDWKTMKRITLLTAALFLLPAIAAVAALCPACQDRSYTKDIGQCKVCGGITTSGEFQLCLACSAKLHQCEHCRASLPAAAVATAIDRTKDGTYTAGRWEYRYTISNAGSRSEGYYGKLLFDGQPLPEPATLNDYYQTPWGAMYWVGEPFVAFGVHGWMPKPLPRGEAGQQLPVPQPAAAGGSGTK